MLLSSTDYSLEKKDYLPWQKYTLSATHKYIALPVSVFNESALMQCPLCKEQRSLCALSECGHCACAECIMKISQETSVCSLCNNHFSLSRVIRKPKYVNRSSLKFTVELQLLSVIRPLCSPATLGDIETLTDRIDELESTLSALSRNTGLLFK